MQSFCQVYLCNLTNYSFALSSADGSADSEAGADVLASSEADGSALSAGATLSEAGAVGATLSEAGAVGATLSEAAGAVEAATLSEAAGDVLDSAGVLLQEANIKDATAITTTKRIAMFFFILNFPFHNLKIIYFYQNYYSYISAGFTPAGLLFLYGHITFLIIASKQWFCKACGFL
jgi:hypothetical protein